MSDPIHGIFVVKLPSNQPTTCSYCQREITTKCALLSMHHDYYLHHSPEGCCWQFLKTVKGSEVIRYEGPILIPAAKVNIDEFYETQKAIPTSEVSNGQSTPHPQ